MIVRDCYFLRAERLGHADHVRLHHAAGRGRETEIAIGRVGAQALIEIFFAMMAEGEALRLARFARAVDLAAVFFLLFFDLALVALVLRFGFAMTGLPFWRIGPYIRSAVIAGHSRPKDGVLSHAYDPAIHDEWQQENQYCSMFCISSWMRGSSPCMTPVGGDGYSAASAAPPCAFDQPAGSPMNFSTSASIFGSNCPLVRATARTSFQVVSACRVTPRSPMIFLLCG